MRSYSDAVPQQEKIEKIDNLINVLKEKEKELEQRLDDQDAKILRTLRVQKLGAGILAGIFIVELWFLGATYNLF